MAEGLGRWSSALDPEIGIQGPDFQNRCGESHLVSRLGLLTGGSAEVQEATGRWGMTLHHSFENGLSQGAGLMHPGLLIPRC